VAIILVEVLPEVGGLVATLTEIGGKRALLMVGVPVGRGTIVVVCEHMVVVHIQTSQKGRPARATHGSADKTMPEGCSLFPNMFT